MGEGRREKKEKEKRGGRKGDEEGRRKDPSVTMFRSSSHLFCLSNMTCLTAKETEKYGLCVELSKEK